MAQPVQEGTLDHAIVQWAEAIDRDDWMRREQAAKQLQQFPQEAVARALFERFRKPKSFADRSAAMDGLERFGDLVLPDIRKLAGPGENQLYAINLIGRMQDKDSVEVLIEAMKSPDINIVQAAVESLGLIGDRAAAPYLIEMLSEDPWLALAAIDSLSLIGGPDVVAALRERIFDIDFGPAALGALGKTGGEEEIRILAALLTGDRDRAWLEALVEALGLLAPRVAVWPEANVTLGSVDVALDIARSFLGAESEDRVLGGVFVIGLAGQAQDIQPLVQLLSKDHLERSASRSLVLLGRRWPRGFDFGLGLYRAAIRQPLLQVFAELERIDIVASEAASDANDGVRRSLVQLLSERTTDTAVEVLIDMLWDTVAEIGASAIQALAAIDLKEEQLTRLQQSLLRMENLRAAALLSAIPAQNRFRLEAAFRPIIERSSGQDSPIETLTLLRTMQGEESIKRMIVLYENAAADPKFRYEVFEALAEQLGAEQLQWVLKQMRSGDPVIRPLCVQVLRRIDRVSGDVWVELLHSTERDILGWVIHEIGARGLEKGLPSLRRIFGRADAFLQREILIAMRACGVKDDPLFVQSLRNPHWAVRLEAVRSIEQWGGVDDAAIDALAKESHALVVASLNEAIRKYFGVKHPGVPQKKLERIASIRHASGAHARPAPSVTEGLWAGANGK